MEGKKPVVKHPWAFAPAELKHLETTAEILERVIRLEELLAQRAPVPSVSIKRLGNGGINIETNVPAMPNVAAQAEEARKIALESHIALCAALGIPADAADQKKTREERKREDDAKFSRLRNHVRNMDGG